MNPLALYFASGDSLYPGAALLLTAVATAPYVGQERWTLILRSIAVWLGLAMMVMASPPFSWWADATFGLAFTLWFLSLNRSRLGPRWSRVRGRSTAILAILLLWLPISEFSRRSMPAIRGTASDHLVVIGDSISAGIDPRVPVWPLLMQQRTGVQVKNLSQAGADVAAARLEAASVVPQDTVVLIEIGGNDLLSGTSSEDFGRGLESLLSRLTAPGRTLVMFELPLLPHRIAYGQIQRQLAGKYGVFLIPKHYFTNVLGAADATSDGLHLSDVGARKMAALVTQALSPLLMPVAAPHRS